MGYPDGHDDGDDDKDDKPAADVGGPAFDVGSPDAGEKMDSDLIPDSVPTTFRLVNESGAAVGIQEAGQCVSAEAEWVIVEDKTGTRLWMNNYAAHCKCSLVEPNGHCPISAGGCSAQRKDLAAGQNVTYQWDGIARAETSSQGRFCLHHETPKPGSLLTGVFCWHPKSFGDKSDEHVPEEAYTCDEVPFNFGDKVVEKKISGTE